MESPPRLDSKASDPRNQTKPSSKSHVSSNPTSTKQPPPPNFNPPVDFPPLPSVNLNLHKNKPVLSSKIQKQAYTSSASKLLLTDSSPQNHVPIDLIVGSMPIYPEAVTDSPLQTKGGKNSADVHPTEASNLAKAFQGSYDLHPCHQISGKACVSISLEEKQRLINSMNFIVVVKFSHFRPKFQVFNSFLLNMGFSGKFRIMEYDLKHVFVEFVIFEDFCKLWMLKSCLIGGFRGRFFKWDDNFLPRVESFLAPIWIHLPHFPLYLFNEKTIISVACVFGKPLCIDSASRDRNRVGKLSFCVEKDVRLKGPTEILVEFVGEGIIVERFTQLVNYGEIPEYCSLCSHIGHCLEDCKLVFDCDKPSGTVTSRLKEREMVDSAIPIISIFGRLNDSMKGKGKMIEEKFLDSKMVQRGDNSVGVQNYSELDTIAKLQVAAKCSVDSSVALPLEPTNSVPVHIDHALRQEASNTANIFADQNMEAEEKDRDHRPLREMTLTGATDFNSDNATDQCLLNCNQELGAAGQCLLADIDDLQPPEMGDAYKDYETAVGDTASLGGKPDDTVQNSDSNSDCSAVPLSIVNNSISREVKHDLLPGIDSLQSQVDVSADTAVDMAVKDHGIQGENSASNSTKSSLLRPKALNITLAGTSSIGSLEGTSGDVIKWLSKEVGMVIQDTLKQKRVHLPPRSTLSGKSAPKVPVILNKSAKKKAKMKKKKLAQQQASTSTPKANSNVSPLPPWTILQQDLNGFVVDSEEDMLSSSADSQDTNQEQLDLLPLLEAYRKGHFDVKVTPNDSKNKHSWAEEMEVAASTTLSFDEISGVPVVKSFKPASRKYHKEQFEPP